MRQVSLQSPDRRMQAGRSRRRNPDLTNRFAVEQLQRAFRRRVMLSILILSVCFILITLAALTLSYSIQRAEARRANEVATRGAEELALALSTWQGRLDKLIRARSRLDASGLDTAQSQFWMREAQNLVVSSSGLIEISVMDRHGAVKITRFFSEMLGEDERVIAAAAAAAAAVTATANTATANTSAANTATERIEGPHEQSRRVMTIDNIRDQTTFIMTERLALAGQAAVTAVMIVPQEVILAQLGQGPNDIRFIRAPGNQVLALTWAGRVSGCLLLPAQGFAGGNAQDQARCNFIAEAGLPGLAGFSLILAEPETSQSLVWLAVFLLISLVAATLPWILASDSVLPTQELAEMRHDLRALAFNTWLLLDHLGNTPSPELLERAREGLGAATHSLRDMTRPGLPRQSGDVRPELPDDDPRDAIERISPSAFLRSITELMRPLARGAQLTIELDLGPNLPDLMVDRARLTRILVNLVTNAARHAPGSLLRISATASPPDAAGEITLTVLVSDTGPGLPLLTRLCFVLSARPHRWIARVARPLAPHDHEGRGLAIIRRLSVEAQGQMVLLRRRSGGTTFRLTLPAWLAEPALRPDLNGLCVLGVDDSEQVRIWLSAVLQRCGARVETAGSAQEALTMLERQGFDVLVADLRLPDMSGLELARHLTTAMDSAKAPYLIAYTSFIDAKVEQGCRDAGFAATLVKRPDPAALLLQLAGIAKIRPSAAAGADPAGRTID
jgi:CheY-like chemotaxis protein